MQIVFYHIGQTCDNIPDEYDPDGYTGIIPNSIILLSEVSNEKSSLDVVLEILRQSLEFRDYHFGDNGNEIIVPPFYLLGQKSLSAMQHYEKTTEGAIVHDLQMKIIKAIDMFTYARKSGTTNLY